MDVNFEKILNRAYIVGAKVIKMHGGCQVVQFDHEYYIYIPENIQSIGYDLPAQDCANSNQDNFDNTLRDIIKHTNENTDITFYGGKGLNRVSKLLSWCDGNTLDLSYLNVSKIQHIEKMIYHCKFNNIIIDGWDIQVETIINSLLTSTNVNSLSIRNCKFRHVQYLDDIANMDFYTYHSVINHLYIDNIDIDLVYRDYAVWFVCLGQRNLYGRVTMHNLKINGVEFSIDDFMKDDIDLYRVRFIKRGLHNDTIFGMGDLEKCLKVSRDMGDTK